MLYYTAEKRIHITEKNKQTNKQKKTRNTDLCNYMMTYKTTDKTDHYMEYLRFSLRLKLLS